jgi:hypothetical protein
LVDNRDMDYEKLGAFYLGTAAGAQPSTEPEAILYDSRDLLTHAVCVGMTGSGKTGLCLAMIEEALIDGVPVIAIDPKGDLGNLMLTFPALAASDFLPWVDPAQAQRDGVTVEQLAATTAERWRTGLAASGQAPERIARLRAAGDVDIFTPGSEAGLPLSMLRSMKAPPPSSLGDSDAWRDRIESAISGLLALVGIQADPLRSREHVLLSQILDQAWRAGKDLALADLIIAVTKPPFSQVGVFDLETFFPAKERTELALTLNTLLASPSFAAWTKGQPLDIPQLLFSANGKPRVAVMSIAHLGDAERMFFVTLLLQEIISWMRTQPGTSSLRALIFMDEVTGYLPPTAAPPSKKPMMTLFKQARAFGVGMVVASQNPVDLDYKALSNAGTWCLGRLQTERDKARVIEGLEGASTAAGKAFDRAAMEATLAGLTNRVFLVNNVHDDHPVLVKTRWVMSYLAGPLTRSQIQTLMAAKRAALTTAAPATAAASTAGQPTSPTAAAPGVAGTKPIAPGELAEMFVGSGALSPALVGVVKAHYAQSKASIDVWQELHVVAPLHPGSAGDFWEQGEPVAPESLSAVATQAAPGTSFTLLPTALNAKAVGKLEAGLESWVLRSAVLKLSTVSEYDLVSKPGEAPAEFGARVALAHREARDAQVAKLKAKYQPKLSALEAKLQTAEQRVAKERAQATAATADSAISIGASVLGALFGGGKKSITKVASAARSVSRTVEQRGDATRATGAVEQLTTQHQELESELAAEVAALQATAPPPIETLELKPKKADITVTRIALLWRSER